MLTNRRSTMPLKHARMPSWHAGSKTVDPQYNQAAPTYAVDNAPRSLTPAIMTSTTPTLPGYTTTRLIGAIHGTASLTHKVPKSFIKSLSSSLTGSWGEPKPLTQVLYQARDQAIERMTKDAIDKGANAVVGLQIRETEVMGCVVVSVSATACLVEKEKGQISPMVESTALPEELQGIAIRSTASVPKEEETYNGRPIIHAFNQPPRFRSFLSEQRSNIVERVNIRVRRSPCQAIKHHATTIEVRLDLAAGPDNNTLRRHNTKPTFCAIQHPYNHTNTMLLKPLSLLLLAARTATSLTSNLTQILDFGPNPRNVTGYIYVPANLPKHAPILVAPHWCHGTAQDVFAYRSWAAAGDTYGFISIYPNSPNAADQCWDVSSRESLTHEGGGDALGIVSMNLQEEIKQWTSVFGVGEKPAEVTKDTPLEGWTRYRYGTSGRLGD
ncbi:hypothetical protein E8E13_000747 [Curvularia kusanoi]|uniref:Uncharacterized protein n=1 Tax=Curvularia kusanoi TaxID=90978 RepID=A0A9P4T334_CURKU|nr:hypothetical protein E8E13_000747 [Curvularia kusanoi]